MSYQTKTKVEHVRKLAVAFEKLAADQTTFAKEREEHVARAAEIDKQLTVRAAALAEREATLTAKEAKVKNLEIDLERRLAILRNAAA